MSQDLKELSDELHRRDMVFVYLGLKRPATVDGQKSCMTRMYSNPSSYGNQHLRIMESIAHQPYSPFVGQSKFCMQIRH